MVAPSIITSDDLLTLVNPSVDSESGYYGVYRHRDRWRGVVAFRAFRIDVCESQPTPRAAAVEIVRWWQSWFGSGWKRFFAARRAHPFTVVPSGDGWRVMVFLLGKQFYLSRQVKRGRTRWVARPGQGWKFVDKPSAKDAYRKFLTNRYGIFAPLAGLELRREFFAPPYRAKPRIAKASFRDANYGRLRLHSDCPQHQKMGCEP